MTPTEPSAAGRRGKRGAMRLTLRVRPDGVELVEARRLDKVVPPGLSETPELGRHGGHWVSVHDADGRVLFARGIDPNLLGAAEVFSPDGTIRHVVGRVDEAIVEVLVPDDADSAYVTLAGEPLDPEERHAQDPGRSRVLGRFELRGDEFEQKMRRG
jgi:hypothetical protein